MAASESARPAPLCGPDRAPRFRRAWCPADGRRCVRARRPTFRCRRPPPSASTRSFGLLSAAHLPRHELAALLLSPALCAVGRSRLAVCALPEGSARSALSRCRGGALGGRGRATLLIAALPLAEGRVQCGIRLPLLRLLGKRRRGPLELTTLVAHLDLTLC